jgi:hypothetical protein
MKATVEVGWLAGIMDGEGTITLNLGTDRPKGHMHLCIAFSNTSLSVIEKVQKILGKMGVNFKTYCASKANRGWKDIHQVKVMQIDSVKVLLNILVPHLTCKRQQAALMLEFLAYRECGKRKAYTEECIALAGAIRALNHRGSVETARESRESVKIQSDLPGDRKNVAEMPTSKPN